MILNGTHNPVETSSDVTSKSFRILASKKAFEILSSGLYSHKIKAIVRELGTNAADAHTAAGNPAPFEVILPNHLFAYFEVKDFGTGLSEADVLNLYTTYFDSNKTTSNAFTGCLGMGSKSPFSYTDSFTVESRFNGTKTTYTAYLDTTGIPAVSKMTAEDTDEPNGLTVRIPVQADDFHEFAGEVFTVYQWFKVRPVVHGADQHTPAEYETLFDGDSYSIGRQEKQDDGGPPAYRRFEAGVLVMGNVAYPLDFSKTQSLYDWKNYGLVLYADIGSVEIAASREALSYDERTVAYLAARGEELTASLPAHVEAHVAEADTLWAARERLFKIKSLLKDVGIEVTTWRGQELTTEVKVETIDVPCEDTPSVSRKLPEADVVLFERHEGRWSRRTHERPIKNSLSDTNTVRADGKQVWLADIKNWKPALSGVVGLDTLVYVITEVRGNSDFLARTGLDAVIRKVSGIPKKKHVVPPRAAKPKVARVPVYEFCPEQTGDAGNIRNAAWWKKATAPGRGVYVVIDRFSPVGGTTNYHLRSVTKLLSGLGKGKPVYGVRNSDLPLTGTWETLEDYVKRVVKETTKELGQTLATTQFASSSGVPDVVKSFGQKKLTPLLKGLRKSHPFRKTVEAVLAAQKTRKAGRLATYQELLNSNWGIGVDKVAWEDTKLYKQCAAVIEAYPLLDVVSIPHYSRKDDRSNAVIEYIKLIDATNR